MDPVRDHTKPHLICIPLPTQSHINAMLGLSKLLHHKGFHITFVNTEFNYDRLLRSGGGTALLDGFPDFRFETIPDGLPASDLNATQDVVPLIHAIDRNFLAPFRQLVHKLNSDLPVTSIVSDGFNSFSLTVGKELGIPVVLFFTIAACVFMAYKEIPTLYASGILPPKDENYLINGYLDTIIDSIPGMGNISLRDLPSNIRTTDANDILVTFSTGGAVRAFEASAVVVHTFDALERDVLHALSSMLPGVHAIGPLHLLLNQLPEHDPLYSFGSSLWNVDKNECLHWLDAKAAKSVLYVSFGSITVITPKQLVEFAWGLANSKYPFLWILRPDMVEGGESVILLSDFFDEVKERSLIVSWCEQEKVLSHPSVGGFLTHNGWNSTIESIAAGVPMLCWPFFTDQLMNCKYCRDDWRVGIQSGGDVERGEVEKLVRELMEGEKGEEVRKNAVKLKELAEEATSAHGSSTRNLDKLISYVLSSKQRR